jgi:hypothetical protein
LFAGGCYEILPDRELRAGWNPFSDPRKCAFLEMAIYKKKSGQGSHHPAGFFEMLSDFDCP